MQGRPDWCEALPVLTPAKCARLRSSEDSGLANMVANLQESRIPPTTAGWSWQCGPALNPPKFSIRIHPLDPGDHMLSQKLLVDIRVDPFAGRNQLGSLNWQNLPSYRLHSFFPPLCYGVRSMPLFSGFFRLKNMFLLLLRSC
jgi:hypothetical protein